LLNPDRTIVLASSSPRRKELLEKIGLKFIVDPGDYPEDLHSGLIPERMVKSNSIGKALAVAKEHPDAIIIAADTIGVLRRKIMGKPRTKDEARKMLLGMSGKSHRVITGLTILDTANNKMVTLSVETRVFFKNISEKEIISYVQTGEPLDKAGAYAIQGLGSVIVEKIDGDFYNVMGLPLSSLVENLKDFGIKVL
jgi:septum formation protein